MGLAAALTVGVERFGFNPTDQGFILAQSWRILHGEMPHSDLISARPLGSGYLHTIDFLVPGPLFLASSFVATLQMITATVAIAAWTTGVGVSHWGVARTALVASAAVVNIHLFPMNAWHTIDGIFLVAVGWFALDKGLSLNRQWLTTLGLVAIGFAAVTKQSFVPAVIATLIFLLVRNRHDAKRLVLDAAALASIPVVYLVIVAAGDGIGAMVDQLSGGSATAGQRMFEIAAVPGALPALGVFAAAVLAALTARWLSIRLVAVAIGGLVLGAVVVTGHLERAGNWGIVLWWVLAGAIGVHAIVHRMIPWRPLGLLLLGYMASLSWGYDSPTLLGGSLVLLAVDLIARDVPAFGRARVVGGAVAIALFVVTLGWMADLRLQDPYRDRPYAEMTASLGASAESMRGIRTNPATSAYLEQISKCIDKYPADRVAVLPDNAFVYPALGVRNPFPIDWPLPGELVADTRDSLDVAADTIERRGDYLVLFQTVTDSDLAAGRAVPPTVADGTPIVDPAGIADRILSRLSGQQIKCGSFVGVWMPGRR